MTDPESKQIIPHPEYSGTVKKIYELYLTAEYSLDRIVEWLNNRGILPSKGKKWHKSGVERILRNPVYYGDFEWKGKVYKGVHEPIIDYETFKKCNEIMDRNLGRPYGMKSGKGEKRGEANLSGLLYNEDDRKFTAEKKKGIQYYGSIIPDTKPRKRFYIREDEVFEALDQLMEEIKWTEIFANEVKEIAHEILNEEKAYLKENLSKVERKKNKLYSQKQRLLDLYLGGGLDRPLFMAKQSELEKQIADQTEILRRHENADISFDDKLAEIVDAFTIFPRVYKNAKPNEKGKILKKLLEKIVVDYENNVRTIFKEPFSLWLTESIKKASKLTDPKDLVRTSPLIRTERDSNPRYAINVYTRSRRAPSTTRPPAPIKIKE